MWLNSYIAQLAILRSSTSRFGRNFWVVIL
jgi:hypothetical protein